MGRTGLLHARARGRGPHALNEGRLSSAEADAFKKKLEVLRDEYEQHGGSFDGLMDFRHAELGHSLYLDVKKEGSITLSPLWELAHDTFELVLQIERELVQRGVVPIVNLDDKFHEWRDRGEVFWSTRLPVGWTC